MIEVLEFFKEVYAKFGFRFEMVLSTRPEMSIGNDEDWVEAESILRTVLIEFCDENADIIEGWKMNPGDGAFYGPKIDIYLHDSLGRKHQSATVQLDFVLPSKKRFNLKVVNENNKVENVVMIHRAILGSLERFIGILLEHCGGRLPFWLSPKQVKVLSMSKEARACGYALEVRELLFKNGFYADVDVSNANGGNKMKKALKQNYSVLLFVGENEAKENCVSIRVRNVNLGMHPLKECVEWLKELNRVYA